MNEKDYAKKMWALRETLLPDLFMGFMVGAFGNLEGKNLCTVMASDPHDGWVGYRMEIIVEGSEEDAQLLHGFVNGFLIGFMREVKRNGADDFKSITVLPLDSRIVPDMKTQQELDAYSDKLRAESKVRVIDVEEMDEATFEQVSKTLL